MAMEAKAIAVTHQQGCERAYAESQRRLGSIESKTDDQTRKLDEIQRLAASRYWTTVGGVTSIGVMLAWQVFVYFHPHVG